MAIAPHFHVLLYEGSGTQPLEAAVRAGILSALLDRGYSVSTGGARAGLSDGESTLLVLGCFGGNAPELEDAAGARRIATLDISAVAPEKVADAVDRARGERPMNQPGLWKPWFPVIDYSRCTNCMQCLSFCLFDVYGVSEDNKIQVQNNDNCKTNCPACSRVCPEVAIMFPKYQGSPINGDEVNENEAKREKIKVDISSLLGGDIYSTLKDRSAAFKSRFSKERSADKALDERKKCLTKLVGDGFIPADVLASLPSTDIILKKAEEAKAKAAAALAAQ